MRSVLRVLAVILALAVLPSASNAWPGDHSQPHPLEGAWRLVGTLAEHDDVIVPNRKGFEEYKVLADGYFMWTSLQDGKILGHAGGEARLGRATYTERVDYASEAQFTWMVGRRHLFKWKLVDGLWYHTGRMHGLADGPRRVAEVWERVR
jgi:hypothetical protein